MMYYGGPGNSTAPYPSQPMMGPPMYMQPTAHGSYLVPMIPSTMPAVGSVAEAPQSYEQNGTVYFYDQNQYGANGGVSNNPYDASATNGAVYAPAPMNYYPQQQ